jgi:hypothetical protein
MLPPAEIMLPPAEIMLPPVESYYRRPNHAAAGRARL